MDIEKERLAFEQSILPNGLSNAVCWTGESYEFKGGGRCMTQDYFEVWMKAKAHAAEMAKPEQECNLECSNGWYFLSTHSDCGDYYRITSDMGKDECLAYAERNNYRIVE